LILRFTDDKFDPDISATIGVDFKTKNLVVHGNKAKLALWVRFFIKRMHRAVP
jgi:Ras-related protein Rab-18